MSRYPHRTLAERNKRVQMQNCIEDKFLKQKLDAFSRERLCIDRELRRISLAKESLMESLDRYTAPPTLASKRFSLPCLIEGCRKGTLPSPVGTRRRHTVESVQDLLHTAAENKQKLKPLSFSQDPTPSVTEGIPKNSPYYERKSHLQRPRSAFRVASPEIERDTFEIRVASPVTASLIQSGHNRFTNVRSTRYSRRSNIDETPLHLPKLPSNPAKRDLNPQIPRKITAGKPNPRDGMLETNLKSKFRQIGSVVMATAILRVAHKKTKEQANGKGNEG